MTNAIRYALTEQRDIPLEEWRRRDLAAGSRLRVASVKHDHKALAYYTTYPCILPWLRNIFSAEPAALCAQHSSTSRSNVLFILARS